MCAVVLRMQQITEDAAPAATNRSQLQIIQPALHTNDGARKWPTAGLTELVPTFPGQGRLIGLRKGDEVLGELAKLGFFFQPCHPLFWCCQECEVKYYLSNDSS